MSHTPFHEHYCFNCTLLNPHHPSSYSSPFLCSDMLYILVVCSKKKLIVEDLN